MGRHGARGGVRAPAAPAVADHATGPDGRACRRSRRPPRRAGALRRRRAVARAHPCLPGPGGQRWLVFGRIRGRRRGGSPGMRIVDALAARWGYRRGGGFTTTWFGLAPG